MDNLIGMFVNGVVNFFYTYFLKIFIDAHTQYISTRNFKSFPSEKCASFFPVIHCEQWDSYVQK